ncbi:hypothetical protein Sa4125_00340 [Aureimonas sp. SA4125]|uniref:hypothetical protein n=1 Tax=Aureimonas sp. SA4125 TaxID=2826993 RepID=UPI001CC7413C|nr:hypothetical protein [Aureimonas sp. SA4125]BDA82492.1 hypothetical protein Sa4125_00340 [Aureimonas sp. SA4125]
MDIETAMRPRVREGAIRHALDLQTVARTSGTVADQILAFATGGTAGCSSGRAMARFYLVLTHGAAIPLGHTDIALDGTRQAWWRVAMDEYGRGMWGGTGDGADRVRARHPEIAREADAATNAYRAAKG